MIKAVLNMSLSRSGEERYVLIDDETGEVVDDAQGYGYKDAAGAHRAYAYWHRDKSKDKKKNAKRKKIKKWMESHRGFMDQLDGFAFEIYCKKSWGPDDKIDAKFIQSMLENNSLEFDGFSASEFLRVWRSK